MSFKFNCPFCGEQVPAEEAWIGKVALCPCCHKSITIKKPVQEQVAPQTSRHSFQPQVAPQTYQQPVNQFQHAEPQVAPQQVQEQVAPQIYRKPIQPQEPPQTYHQSVNQPQPTKPKAHQPVLQHEPRETSRHHFQPQEPRETYHQPVNQHQSAKPKAEQPVPPQEAHIPTKPKAEQPPLQPQVALQPIQQQIIVQTNNISQSKSRIVYILLAIILSLLGIVGVHNIYAGYVFKGLIQLFLTIFLDVIFAVFIVLCFPLAIIPVILFCLLLLWVLIEIIFVTHDANGNPFH